MENNILKLKELLNPSKEDSSYIKMNYNFCLCAITYSDYIFKTYYDVLITLDDEDIEYFSKKYFSKLEEEMKRKINKIKEEYGK